MNYLSARTLELLRLGTQNPAVSFRDDQEDAIRHVVEGRGRLLVVQKTGWGKSAVYFIAAKLLREQGMGPAILISPLLSLMRNQIAAAERMGVRAATIHYPRWSCSTGGRHGRFRLDLDGGSLPAENPRERSGFSPGPGLN